MKRKIWLFIFIALVFVSAVGTAQAALAIPASNETATLIVGVSAYADGGLRARTDMALCQGNEDLQDNPPLNSSGEGVNCIIYQEHTMATSGSIYYEKDVMVDTGNQIDPANNLETTRYIDFSASSDGTQEGNMYSSESTTVTSTSTGATSTDRNRWGTASSPSRGASPARTPRPTGSGSAARGWAPSIVRIRRGSPDFGLVPRASTMPTPGAGCKPGADRIHGSRPATIVALIYGSLGTALAPPRG